MTDPGIVDYLITEGYSFDGDDWIGRDKSGTLTTALKAERSKHGSSPHFKGFEKAYGKLGDEGGWSAETKKVLGLVDERLDKFTSLKEFYDADVDSILDDAWSEFKPVEGFDKRYSTSELSKLSDKMKEQIKDNALEKKRDLEADIITGSTKIDSAKDIEKLDLDFDGGFGITDDRDKERVVSILKPKIDRKKGTLKKLSFRREEGRILGKGDVEDTGLFTTKSFAKAYGWDPSDEEDLEEVRDVIREKGINIDEKDKFIL